MKNKNNIALDWIEKIIGLLVGGIMWHVVEIKLEQFQLIMNPLAMSYASFLCWGNLFNVCILIKSRTLPYTNIPTQGFNPEIHVGTPLNMFTY